MPVDSPEELYGLPLSQFIPERQALVKALRGQKRRGEATEVAGMRRPSVAAWAVNQLVRTQSTAIRGLFDAGDDLAQAQADAAPGRRTADALRGATRRQRDALDDLLRAAQGLLGSEGHPLTAATLERVTDTLRAASIDGASREQVIGGCLSQELQFAGLGIGALATQASGPGATKPTAVATAATAAPVDAAPVDAAAKRKAQQEDRAREAAAVKARKAALAAARQTETSARRAATRAEKALTVAQARREEAAAALATAEERLTAAASRADETAAELATARGALDELDSGP